MKKTAILIDAGFLRAFLPRAAVRDSAAIIEAFALACIDSNDKEEMHRVLYYDCPPYFETASRFAHPMDPTRLPNSEASRNYNNSLLTQLKSKAYFAVRLGEVSFDGWAISEKATTDILNTKRALQADDFQPVLRQKGVDLRIGLDVALMAKDRLIDRIIVVSGDADIVPAMKVARREGVQVVLVSLKHNIKAILREHADLYRDVDLDAVIKTLFPNGIPPKPARTMVAASAPSTSVMAPVPSLPRAAQ